MKRSNDRPPPATQVDWVSRVGYPCRVTKATEQEASEFATMLRSNGMTNVVQRPPEEKPQGVLGTKRRR